MTIYDDDATGDATMTWYTVDEVATHKKESDCWLILGETGEKKVYNITSFLDDHPGVHISNCIMHLFKLI